MSGSHEQWLRCEQENERYVGIVAEVRHLSDELKRLATFIIEEVPGREPSQSRGRRRLCDSTVTGAPVTDPAEEATGGRRNPRSQLSYERCAKRLALPSPALHGHMHHMQADLRVHADQ